jgi:hypothetical protein
MSSKDIVFPVCASAAPKSIARAAGVAASMRFLARHWTRPRFLPSRSYRGSCLKTLFGSKEAFYWTEVQHHQPPKRPLRIVSQSTKTCHQETNVEASSDGLDCRAEIRGSARRYETDLPCLGEAPAQHQ